MRALPALFTFLLLAAPLSAFAGWEPAGVGDCAGTVVGTSRGGMPASARCDASMGGMTAVCWDGDQYKNPALKGAGCSYKFVRAESCTGGGTPGYLFRCAGFGVATRPPAPPPTAAPPPETTVPTTPPAEAPSPQVPAEAPEAPADTSTDRLKVQSYLDLAAELFVAKDYAGALVELRRAQRLVDLEVIRFNVARCYEEMGKKQESIAAYRRYLESNDPTPGAEVRRQRAEETIARLSGVPAPSVPNAAPGFAWRYLGNDDCTAPEVGTTKGLAPAAERCTAERVGLTAVCWDGVAQKNGTLKGCAYKNVLASGCRGGAKPGYLYECASTAPATATTPAASTTTTTTPTTPTTPATTPATRATTFTWQYTGIGDCTGNESGKSKGGMPSSARCTAATAGKVAVCWDGMQQRHPNLRGAGCSYKTTGAAACVGGANPGYLFTCLASGGTPPAVTPTTPATTVTPAPSSAPPTTYTRFTWVPLGIGGCSGGDVASSRGGMPASAKCTKAFAGKTAVCFDGAEYRSPTSSGPGCTYKSVRAEQCQGGSAPGYLYRCGE